MKKHTSYLPLLLVLIYSIGSIAQTSSQAVVIVEGEVRKPLRLTLGDLGRFTPAEVKAKDKEGKEHLYRGVRLVDILDSAGVTLGKNLRGENLSKYLLMKATDGYKVVFSLAEVDSELARQTILLAAQVDGHSLPSGEGPFRIVAPNDKRPARWIRQLVSIKVVFSKE